MLLLVKHYEKSILAVFLFVFISSLVYLIIVYRTSLEITPKDFGIIEKEPDYQSEFDKFGNEVSDKKRFTAFENLGKSPKFLNLVKAGYTGSSKRDMMSPAPIGSCLNPKCRKLLPLIYLETKQPCPFCDYIPIKPPPPPPVRNLDSDGDGMPNLWEKLYGLNPFSADDRITDKDKDGFPNFIEYHTNPEIATNPIDPASHPPLAWRLQLTGSKRALIPLRLIGVKNCEEEKKKWFVHLEVRNHKKQWTAEFAKIGDELRFGSNRFKVTDIIFMEKESWDPSLNKIVRVNNSKIIIKNMVIEDDKPITVNLKKPVYENQIDITMIDSLSQKKYLVKVGKPFLVGDDIIGREKYNVISYEERNYATIRKIQENGKDQVEYRIRKKSVLEKKMEDCKKISEGGEHLL